MENTKIEWAHHTFNPWTGCQNVSPGCDNCYAEALAKRTGMVEWGPHADRKRTSAAYWKQPYKWARLAREAGERHRVFSASMADIFDNRVPPEWRDDLFALIRETPELDWLLLTKRPENMRKMLPPDWGDGYPNVWLGVTAEDQDRFDHRWPFVARTPAAKRFVSYEPALGPLSLKLALDLYSYDEGHWGVRGLSRPADSPDWIIAGGESGPHARPAHPDWFRDVRDQCQAAGVPFFFKQWGEWAPCRFNDLASETIESEELSGRLAGFADQPMRRVGKKAAGRLLDGREWNEVPT